MTNWIASLPPSKHLDRSVLNCPIIYIHSYLLLTVIAKCWPLTNQKNKLRGKKSTESNRDDDSFSFWLNHDDSQGFFYFISDNDDALYEI